MSLVRVLDESLEDFYECRESAPKYKYDGAAEGYVHGRGCLEGAWSRARSV